MIKSAINWITWLFESEHAKKIRIYGEPVKVLIVESDTSVEDGYAFRLHGGLWLIYEQYMILHSLLAHDGTPGRISFEPGNAWGWDSVIFPDERGGK